MSTVDIESRESSQKFVKFRYLIDLHQVFLGAMFVKRLALAVATRSDRVQQIRPRLKLWYIVLCNGLSAKCDTLHHVALFEAVNSANVFAFH